MRFRLLLLVMLMTLIAGAVAATTASAGPGCVPDVGGWCLALELNNTLELTASAAYTSFKDPGTNFELQDEGLPSITCEKFASEGELLNGTAPQITKVKLELTGNCKYVEHSTGCTIAEPITSTAIEGSLSLVEGVPDILYKPESGTQLLTIKVSGAECENAVRISLSGEQLCESAELQTDLLSHLFLCPKSGSSLKNGTKSASLSVDLTLSLLNVGADKWSYESELF